MGNRMSIGIDNVSQCWIGQGKWGDLRKGQAVGIIIHSLLESEIAYLTV